MIDIEMVEIWRDVPGFETGYEVSNMGRIRSKERISEGGFHMKAKILNTRISDAGWLTVTVDRYKKLTIHNVVAAVFLPPPPNEYCTKIRYKDNNPLNVAADNLYWMESEAMKTKARRDMKRAKKNLKEVKYPKHAIVQLRKNGEVVRRYYGIEEVLQVHPSWEIGDLIMNLSGHFPDAYGWVFMYQSDYEKITEMNNADNL